MIRCFVLLTAIALLTSATFAVAQAPTAPSEVAPAKSLLPSAKSLETAEFGSKDIAAASGWLGASHIADWLGPLAPVALSPFFGVSCLSGMAIWGPDWMTNNAMLGENSPLRNPTLFMVLMGLTMLTSLPRLTKVSKPFAQAVDRLETYSVIVILLAVKLVASMNQAETAAPEIAMVQLGIVSVSIDTLLAIAMIVNVLVINSVKFFFEFMVWLTPIPALDACFEVLNKTLCAGLMAIYAFSPTIATVINLLLLGIAGLMLRWISRRVRFYRTMIFDPILAAIWKGFGSPKRPELIVFPKAALGPFAAKSRLQLAKQDDGEGWQLSEANWWRRPRSLALAAAPIPTLSRGWVMHSLRVIGTDGQTIELCFSRRYDWALEELAEQLGVQVEDSASRESTIRDPQVVRGEFS